MTSVVRFLSCKLPLVETLNPLGEMTFVDTPPAADFESGQFLALDHPVHRSPGQSQQFSSLLESQQRNGLGSFSVGVSTALKLSNANAMILLSLAARLLGKAAAQWST